MPNSAPLWLRDLIADHEDAFTSLTLRSGEQLFGLGDPADALYVVRHGALSVYTDDPARADAVAHLSVGDIAGEMGLMAGQPRTATVVAAAPTHLLRLSRTALDRLRSEVPTLGRTLAELAVPRWRRVLLVKAFETLFGSDIDLIAHHDLEARLEWQTLSSSEAICRQGDEGHSMYVIVSGRVLFEVERPDGSVFVVGEAGAGEAVGEFSLLTDAPRSASVIAARQTSYVEIGRDLFSEMVAAHPSVLFALTRQMAERQQRANTHGLASLAPSTLAFAIAPAEPALSVRPLAEALVAELSRLGTTRLIDRALAEETLGARATETEDDDPLHMVVMQWLDEQEAGADYLVFLADAGWTPWTRRCLSRADRVLFIAQPDGSAALGETEARLADSASRCERDLVLWHPPETAEPSGTARWLDARPGYRHFHVRRGDPAHIARLARHIAGTAVGLVLSGGGARGYAHLGVFRAMEELGLPIDYVGGSSFGALIGASRATDQSVDVLMEMCGRFASNRLLFDRTLPVVALNASHNLTKFCQDLFGERQIEDLWLPFFAMTVNLTRGEPLAIRRGALWRTIRSSIAVPGVFAPVVENGELMVDGGVLNNFPVDVMNTVSGSERIIGVLIGTGNKKPRTYDIDTGVSGWRALWRRFNPFVRSPRLPFLSRVIMETLFVGSAPLSERNANLADLVIPLHIRASLLNFEPYRRIAEEGYEQSIEPLRTWAADQHDLRALLPVNGAGKTDGRAEPAQAAVARTA
jgi:predicted acylesterase/phospholipase RssA/CRP-like cAMP-binding protein